MSNNRTPPPPQSASKEQASSNIPVAVTLKQLSGTRTASQHRSQASYYPTSDPSAAEMEYLRQTSSTQPWNAKPMLVSVSSASSSTGSPASSARGGSSFDSGQRSANTERRKSSFQSTMEKTKSKLGRRPSGADVLADDEEDFQRQKAKAIEKQRRKEDYERLGLGERTKFGMPGTGGWKAG